MKTAIAVLIVLFGISWLFVDVVPGTTSMPFHEGYLGLPVIAVG